MSGKKEFTGGAAATKLAAQLLAGTTTNFAVVTNGGTGYPSGATAPFVIVIDRNTATEEKILCSARSGDTFTIAASGRGYDGTSGTGQTHSAQAVVEHVLDAGTVAEANLHVNDATRNDHTQYQKVDGSVAFTGHTAIATGTPTTSIPADAAAVGAGNDLALSTHKHGREAKQETPHTWAIAADVRVPSGDTDYVPGFFARVPAGRTCKLTRARYKINSGTSVTAKLQINGVDATGFTAISVTTTAANTTPSAVALADGDYITLVVTAVSGSPKNMSFSIAVEYAA